MNQLLNATPEYRPHPLTDILPPMTEDEFRDLRKSIRTNGFLAEHPILLHEGQILDGRARYQACLLEGVEPRFTVFSGTNPEAYLLAGTRRRSLTDCTRALTAARVLVRQKERPEAEHLQYGDVRRMYGVGQTMVLEAVRVIRHGAPELIKLIENGEIKVKQAELVARLPVKEQQKVIAAGPRAVTAKATQLRRLQKNGGILPSKFPPGRRGSKPEKQFDPETAKILRELKTITTRLTRYIQTVDGKRFEQYVRDLQIPWIDYGKVKLTDKGEGLKKVNASFVALRPLYRLLVAASRDRAYPIKQLRTMLEDVQEGILDGNKPPVEPENDPAQLVVPESL